jgi:IS4 transposase
LATVKSGGVARFRRDGATRGGSAFLTNHLTFGPTTIAAIYKDRWEIEIFFKTLPLGIPDTLDSWTSSW